MISTAWKLSWFCYESTIGHVSRWWKLAWKGSHRRGDAWSEACRMIQEFFVWWGEQLASLVPDTLRRSFSSVDQTILLSYDEAASSIDAELRKQKLKANIAGAKILGAAFAEKAKAAGIASVVFDRNGARYHGKVKVFADAAREAGLVF